MHHFKNKSSDKDNKKRKLNMLLLHQTMPGTKSAFMMRHFHHWDGNLVEIGNMGHCPPPNE